MSESSGGVRGGVKLCEVVMSVVLAILERCKKTERHWHRGGRAVEYVEKDNYNPSAERSFCCSAGGPALFSFSKMCWYLILKQ